MSDEDAGSSQLDHTSPPKPPVPRRPTSSKPGYKASIPTPIPSAIEAVGAAAATASSSTAPPLPTRPVRTASKSAYIRGPPPTRPAPAPPPTKAESRSPAVRAASVRNRPPRRPSVGARPISMAPARAPPARTTAVSASADEPSPARPEHKPRSPRHHSPPLPGATSASFVPATSKASPPVPASRPPATAATAASSTLSPPQPPGSKSVSMSTTATNKPPPPATGSKPVAWGAPKSGSTNSRSPVRPTRPSLPKRPSVSERPSAAERPSASEKPPADSTARTNASINATPLPPRPTRLLVRAGDDGLPKHPFPSSVTISGNNSNFPAPPSPITLPRRAPPETVASPYDNADGAPVCLVGVGAVRDLNSDETNGNLSESEAEAAADGLPSSSSSSLSLHRLSQQLYLDSDEEDDDLPELPTENLSAEEASNRKCYKIAHEMLTTEQSYVDSLKLIEDLFIEHLNSARASKKEIIPLDTQSLIFGNASQLYALHGGINSGSAHGVLAQLEEKLELDEATNKDGSGVGVVLRDVAPYMKAVYSAYTQTFDNATSTLSELNQKNAAWNAMLQTCHADPRCKKLTLSAFLLEPVQRIPRYKMLLEDYVKRRLPDHPDYGPANEALATISKVAADVNSSITESENMLKMLEIQSKLPSNALTPAVLPSRKLLKEGELQKMCRKGPQPRLVYLFSDCLLYCSTEHTKPRQVPLDTMRVEEIGSVGGVDHCISISQKKRSFILGCISKRDKNQWYRALSEAAEQLSANKESFLEYKGRGSSSSQLNTLAQSSKASAGGVTTKAVIGATAPIWIPDSGVSMCQICTTGFTVLRRRHHCRACGKVICDKCSPYKLKISYDDSIGRVCVACFAEREGTTVEALLEQPSGGGRQRASSFGGASTVKRKKKMKQVLHAPAHGIISGKQDSDTIFAAYMEQKQRGLSLKSWKRSWYVLKTDFCLYQYRAPEDVVAQSAQPLPGFSVAKIEKSAKEAGDRDFVLKITHPSNKPIMLGCESDEHHSTWFRHLSLAARATTAEDEDAAAAAVPLAEDDPLPLLPPTTPGSASISTSNFATTQISQSPLTEVACPAEIGTNTAFVDAKVRVTKGTSSPSPIPQPRPLPRSRPTVDRV